MHGMISNLMTIILAAAYQVWIQICPIACAKKSRVDMMLGQDIQ